MHRRRTRLSINTLLQGSDISYAEFRDLLAEKKVRYMEYDDLGEKIAGETKRRYC